MVSPPRIHNALVPLPYLSNTSTIHYYDVSITLARNKKKMVRAFLLQRPRLVHVRRIKRTRRVLAGYKVAQLVLV